MRLVLATMEFDPERGGVGRYLHDLYAALPRDRSAAFADHGLLEPHWTFAIPKLLWRLRAYPDAVLHVSHVLPFGTVALALKLLTRRKYVVSLHGMDFFSALGHARKRWIMKLILKYADGVTSNTQTLASEIRDFCGREVFVMTPSLPHGTPQMPAVRGLDGEIRLLVVSRLVERKGIDTVIRALHLIPGARLTVAGDGPDRLRLERLAAESGMIDRIEFTGVLSDERKAALFASHDVFVMPTRMIGADREGFGIVFLEAQAHGLPVIAGEGIGVHEAVHPDLREHAVLHTPESLSQAVCALDTRYRGNSKLRERLRAFALSFDGRMQARRFWKWVKSL